MADRVTAKRKKKTKPRVYDNTKRASQSNATQRKIMDAMVQLLVSSRGQEASMSDIAKIAGVSTRSLFRFFRDRASLHQATDAYLQSYIQKSLAMVELHDVAGFARELFKKFDESEDIVMAYLYSSFGRHARGMLRQKLNALLIDHIVKRGAIQMNDERKKKLVIIVELINAKIWQDIKEDFGYSGEEIGPALEWSLNLLIKNL